MFRKFLFVGLMISCSAAWSQNSFENYKEKIPGVANEIEMVAIPEGDFMMGSNASETHRNADEGPQRKVSLDKFWMAKFETTWTLYQVFFNKELELKSSENKTLTIARPTQPYVEMSFGQGKEEGFPVCNVTQYAARAFCAWLYAKTGNFYRLPTEAEWEYAARAGTTSTYYWGEDPQKARENAWYYDNSNGAYHKVGLLKANPWGLYDMIGNVSEWTSDQYDEMFYTNSADKNPYNSPKVLYPHTIRGGHWDDDLDVLRSASRTPSSPKLKQRDPQIPKSNWWLTDAPFLGFRVVRPYITPSIEEIQAYYAVPPKDIP